MKLSKKPIVAILMFFALCPLFITSQTAFASELIADEASFSREEEQGKPPYGLFALIAVALFGIAYQRIPTVKAFTLAAVSKINTAFRTCWFFSNWKNLSNS
jgi:Na+/H+ antiporter NhaC